MAKKSGSASSLPWGITVETYDDLQSAAIAVPLGISLSPRFDADTNLQKFESNGYLQAVKMLPKGRVKLIGGVIDSLYYNARQIGQDPKLEFGKPMLFKNLDMWLSCPADRVPQATIERLRRALIKLRKK